MMDREEAREFENLKNQVIELKSELNSLREFIRGLYAMMDGEEQYGQAGEVFSPDFGGINT